MKKANFHEKSDAIGQIVLDGVSLPDCIFTRRFDRYRFFDADIGTSDGFIEVLQTCVEQSYGPQVCYVFAASTSEYLSELHINADWRTELQSATDALRDDGDCGGLIIIPSTADWIAFQLRPVDVGIFGFNFVHNLASDVLENADCFFGCDDINSWLSRGSQREIALCENFGSGFLESLRKNYCEPPPLA